MHPSVTPLFLRTLPGLFLVFSFFFETFSFAQESPTKAPPKEETWQVIYLAGQRIGYTRSTVETVGTDASAIVKTTSDTFMTIKRFGQTLVMKQALTTEETLAGDLRRFRFEMANPPAMSSVTSGKIDGRELSLTQEVNGKPKTTIQPWQDGVKSPVFQDRVLKDNPLRPGETRTFETFVPEFCGSIRRDQSPDKGGLSVNVISLSESAGFQILVDVDSGRQQPACHNVCDPGTDIGQRRHIGECKDTPSPMIGFPTNDHQS